MMRATESEKISSTAMINLVSYVADSAHICRNDNGKKKKEKEPKTHRRFDMVSVDFRSDERRSS